MKRLTPIGVVLALVFAIVAAGGGSCYSPEIDDCQYACAPPSPGVERCPEGLVCNADLRCVSAVQMRCGPPIGSDGGPPIIDSKIPDSSTTGDGGPPMMDSAVPPSD